MRNADAYPSDQDKNLFVLSYMSEGDANSWKEEFVDSAEQAAAQTGTTLTFGNYKQFKIGRASCRERVCMLV